jgi:hypothetical protein
MFSSPIQAGVLSSLMNLSAKPKTVQITRDRNINPHRSSIYSSEFAERVAISFVLQEEEAQRLKCVYTETEREFKWLYQFKDESSYLKWNKFFHSNQILSERIQTVYIEGNKELGMVARIEVI